MLVFEDDGELAANICGGERTETLGGVLRQYEVDLPQARIVGIVVSFLGGAQVFSGDDGGAVD